jgi:hypothetical protein
MPCACGGYVRRPEMCELVSAYASCVWRPFTHVVLAWMLSLHARLLH